MYCTNCGNQLKEGDRFCTNCGHSFIDLKKIAESKKKNNIIIGLSGVFLLLFGSMFSMFGFILFGPFATAFGGAGGGVIAYSLGFKVEKKWIRILMTIAGFIAVCSLLTIIGLNIFAGCSDAGCNR